MQSVVINYFDQKTKIHTGSEYYIDGKQLDLLKFREVMKDYECVEDLIEEDEHIEIEESQDFLEACIDTAIDVMEVIESPYACDECKMEALMSLVALGATGAINGCLVVEEE